MLLSDILRKKDNGYINSIDYVFETSDAHQFVVTNRMMIELLPYFLHVERSASK